MYRIGKEEIDAVARTAYVYLNPDWSAEQIDETASAINASL